MIHLRENFYICCLQKPAWYHPVILHCYFRWWSDGEFIIKNSLTPLFPSSPPHVFYLYFPSLGKQTCPRKLLHFAFTHWDSWPTEQNLCSCPAHPKQPHKQRDFLLPSGQFRLCCQGAHNIACHGKLVLTGYVNALWWRLVQYIPTQRCSADGVLHFLHRTSSSLLSW